MDTFENTKTLGSFSPEMLFIKLNRKYSEVDLESTFQHEFGHLRHYFSSYLGIKHFSYWAKMLTTLHSNDNSISPEEFVTNQSQLIVYLSRQKQILSIDDEYYYEINNMLKNQAIDEWEKWTVSEVFGKLFDINGFISNHHFWASRFYIGPKEDQLTIGRIPVGMRTLLEHMAISIDFLDSVNRNSIFENYESIRERAYHPDLLHYYCLTHWIGPAMKEKYDSILHSYFVTGQLVSLICEIPFDDYSIWQSLISYAQKNKPEIVSLMQYPHPSFLFPLVK